MNIVYEPHFERSAAYDEDKLIGQCNYHDAINSWTIVHTEVDPEYGGQGIARKLVKCLIEEAEKKCIKLNSTCSYASKVLQEQQ